MQPEPASDNESVTDDYFSGDEIEIEPDLSDDETPDESPADSNDEGEVTEPEPEPELDIRSVSQYNKEIVIVRPENRVTPHVLNLFEMTEIVSIRATQIAQYANCMVDIKGLDDPIKMARRELMMRKCPLVLKRTLGERRDADGEVRTYAESWFPNEMTFAVTYSDV